MRFERQKEKLIRELKSKGIKSPTVLNAIKKVARHAFIPSAFEFQAYDDKALPIGYGQTISHPYTVAKMTELLKIKKGDKILEIGTGSGYQCAILCELGAHVYTIEIDKQLAEKAKKKLLELGYKFAFRRGDGRLGWPEYAPFKGIIITAASANVPKKLFNQLESKGKLVIPLGLKEQQTLTLYIKTIHGIEIHQFEAFNFVSLTRNRYGKRGG
jgi:protein-L-isoaspartate(D-aspartate) O-methyltransferase